MEKQVVSRARVISYFLLLFIYLFLEDGYLGFVTLVELMVGHYPTELCCRSLWSILFFFLLRHTCVPIFFFL